MASRIHSRRNAPAPAVPAETRDPKTGIRRKPETRNPKGARRKPARRANGGQTPSVATSPHGLRIEVHPATPDRWTDLEQLFGDNGACAGCWCMWWRLPAAVWRAQKGEANRAALRRLVQTGPAPGLLAYADSQPVGWCALAPRTAYARFATSRTLQPVDDRPVWSVVCFFVARAYRRRGVTAVLLKAAAEFARSQGATLLEGYPVEPRSDQADTFVYHGLASTFRRAGFQEVARRTPTRPIMRRALQPG